MRTPSLLSALLLVAACSGSAEETTISIEPIVFTTFGPTQWMAEQLTGGEVDVVCPVPPGENPHTWRPDRDAIYGYQSAKLVVLHGADYEHWVSNASLPRSRVVDVSSGLKSSWVRTETVTHSHGDGPAHSHAGVNPHLWLDPRLAQAQADALSLALRNAFPDVDIAPGAKQLRDALAVLDKKWGTLANVLKRTKVVAPGGGYYDYVAKRYGFTVDELRLSLRGAWSESLAGTLRGIVAMNDNRAVLLVPRPFSDARLAQIESTGVTVHVQPTGERASGPDDPKTGGFAAEQSAALDRLAALLREK